VVFEFFGGSSDLSLKKNIFLTVNANTSSLNNVSGLIIGPFKSKAEYILTTMTVRLLAASALLVQSGTDTLLVSDNFKLACSLQTRYDLVFG
jgi:hypothetical protein